MVQVQSRNSGYSAFVCLCIALLSSKDILVSSFTSPWSANSLMMQKCSVNKLSVKADSRAVLRASHQLKNTKRLLRSGTATSISVSMVSDILEHSDILIAVTKQLFDTAFSHNIPHVFLSYIIPSAGAAELASVLIAKEALTASASTTQDLLPGILSEVSTFSSLDTAAAAIDFNAIFSKAVMTGKAGALAAAVQVVTLMWLRTALNYQYRFGTSTSEALKTLWAEGGLKRLYQGLPFALLQGPLSRFGDTACNALVSGALDALDPLGGIPVFLRMGVASGGAAAWRIVLLPLDAAKTSLQVNGEKGLQVLKEKVQLEGIQGLFAGALAGSAATFVGHYPWFLTYNYLSDKLPTAQDVIGYIHVMTSDIAVNTAKTLELQGSDLDVLITAPVLAHFPVDLTVYSSVISHLLTNTEIDPTLFTIIRSAFIGLCASSLSDVCSNSLRVLKTVKQTNKNDGTDEQKFKKITPEIAKNIFKSTLKNLGNLEIVKSDNLVIIENENKGEIVTKMESKSYLDIAKEIIEKEGLGGLFGRGLQTRVLSNALQAMLFSVLFKYFSSATK